MKLPVIGVIGNTRLIEDRFTAQLVGETNLRAVADVAGALPMMFAGTPEITDIVKTGGKVTVKYHDLGGGAMHAAEVRVN